MDFNLQPLWVEILKIYEVYKAICIKHNLRFYTAYGTTLGAVRHHGFIPWDDDFDVCMPREDYEKFCEIAPMELPQGLDWVSLETREDYFYMFGKIALSDKASIERLAQTMNVCFPGGIFIDVFPVDGLPTSWVGRVWHLLRRGVLKVKEYNLFVLKRKKERFTVRFFLSIVTGFMCALFYRKINTRRGFAEEHKRILCENPFYASKYVHEVGWFLEEWKAFNNISRYANNIYGVPKWIEFETTRVPVQNDTDAYLRCLYGNYMSLPAEEQRRPSHCKMDGRLRV